MLRFVSCMVSCLKCLLRSLSCHKWNSPTCILKSAALWLVQNCNQQLKCCTNENNRFSQTTSQLKRYDVQISREKVLKGMRLPWGRVILLRESVMRMTTIKSPTTHSETEIHVSFRTSKWTMLSCQGRFLIAGPVLCCALDSTPSKEHKKQTS